MVVLTAAPDFATDADSNPTSAWNYRWEIVFTQRSSTESPHTYETRETARTVDELVEKVLHKSYDPRIVSFSYYRYAELDIDAAPTECSCCGELFRDTPPQQLWRTCSCGAAHVLYACVVCGVSQVYPAPTLSCTTQAAPLPPLEAAA